MKKNSPLKKFSYVLIWILVGVFITFVVYYGSIPIRYRYKPGDQSSVDITAPRAVVDQAATEKSAQIAKLSVEEIYVRSEELSTQSLSNITEFYATIGEIKSSMRTDTGAYAAPMQTLTAQLVEQVATKFGMTLSAEDAYSILNMHDSVLQENQQQTTTTAMLILSEMVDDISLQIEIDKYTETTNDQNNTSTTLMATFLKGLLRPNAIVNEEATEVRRTFEYNSVKNDNPVMIEKGARIILRGETIDDATYSILMDLDMIEISSFDYMYLLSVALYVFIIVFGVGLYLSRAEEKMIKNRRNMVSLSIAAFVPLFSAIYLTGISPLLVPVCFFSVICANYFGTQTSFILSSCIIILALPMTGYNPEFIAVSIFGVFVTALVSGDQKRKFDSALLILLTGFLSVLGSVGYNLMTKNIDSIPVSAIWALIIGTVSVILAIGLMPIFELISNTISPIRLIDLSQPGHSLQKRLFMEAPGTFHHSIMVANLADAAAEAIGANALLSKVAAYYHDIGKLEKPDYFTENQSGVNPHDMLTPEESAAIILTHPENGVKIARKGRLPMGLLRFIQEHHGTTTLAFFYHKAKEQAVANGAPEPAVQKYKYKGPTPSSKESAILMLADTCEAAIKSTGIKDLTEAQELFRKLIKQKIDMDQLVNSDLSFRDIELIIRAFVQVYAGVFHERIKYPDDPATNRK